MKWRYRVRKKGIERDRKSAGKVSKMGAWSREKDTGVFIRE